MPSRKTLSFNEQEIQALFGHEAAENEAADRLREYYFKTDVYNQVITDLPLRILVGHKGTGKSALFQVAMGEERERGKLVVLIKPDDVVGLGNNSSDFLSMIREWKTGIIEIIASKILTQFGVSTEADWRTRLGRFGGKLTDFVSQTLSDLPSIDLSPANRRIVERYQATQSVYIYIDDLDRGWQGRHADTSRLSALLNAVRDLSTDNRGCYFRIALRSDVYFLVRTSDESTDKVEGSVIWHTWTNHDIFILWVKRTESFFGRSINEPGLKWKRPTELATYLEPIIESRFQGQGHWHNAPMYRVFMSLIRQRPRDLVKLCTLAARQANIRHDSKIRTQDVRRSFEEYSQGRLQDTINEFRSEVPDIQRLLFGMRPNRRERMNRKGYIYTTDELLTKIKAIEERGHFNFAGKRAAQRDLASFMYKINFLTGRKVASNGLIQRTYFETNRYLSNKSVDFGFDWEVHPAYRWALQPDDVSSILDNLNLTSDDG